jgi:RNA polymerase sigma-70 factor (ECF subfamily)
VVSNAPSIDEVADRLSAPLRRYLLRFVGEPYTAEDLLQETLVRIAKGLPGFERRSSLKTWAFRIATTTAIDHLRKCKDTPSIVAVDESEALAAEEPGVGERLVIDEMNSCVRDEIDSLPGDYRAAIVLHDLEGLTAAETAEIAGCSTATAKIRIHRARARLKKALENDCTFYYDRDQVLRCDRKGHAPEVGPSE